MVVELHPEDLPSGTSQDDPLRMMYFQEELERQSWLQGNQKQTAPAQRMTDFVNGRLSSDLNPSSYAPGLIASPLHFWMPKFDSYTDAELKAYVSEFRADGIFAVFELIRRGVSLQEMTSCCGGAAVYRSARIPRVQRSDKRSVL